MSTPPTIQTNPLEPVFSGVPVVIPQEGLVSPTWNKWFVDLREKVNVINSTLAAWSGITPVTGLTPGTYGDTTHYPIVTVNEFGLITDVTEQLVSGGGGAPMHVTNASSSYTVALSDVPASSANRGIIVTNSSTSNLISINTFANTSIPVGTDLLGLQVGAGTTTFSGMTGVAFVGPTITGGGAGSLGRAIQIATDVWAISGNLAYIAGGDPYWANVVSLVHFDGPNGSTTFTDVVSGVVWTPTGATISTTQSKFGGSSGYFNGSAYLKSNNLTSFGFGAGDFTFECWVYCTPSGSMPVFDNRSASNQGNGFYADGGSGPYLAATNNAALAPGTTLSSSTWHHFALCKQAGTLYGFADGILGFTVADARTLASSAVDFIGSNYLISQFYTGYIDEMRITKGVARYTATFTPPTAPFPNA